MDGRVNGRGPGRAGLRGCDGLERPGLALLARLSEMGMSQAELAQRAGLSAKHVNQMVKGAVSITHETAVLLELVTGTDAEAWSELESRFRCNLIRAGCRKPDPADRAWLDRLPTAVLIERGYLPAEVERRRELDAVLRFFGVASRNAWEEVWHKHLSAGGDPSGPTCVEKVAAWIRMCELDVQAKPASPYSTSRFRSALPSAVRALVRESREEGEEICAASGVVVLFIDGIEGSSVAAASWWDHPRKAVIALDGRAAPSTSVMPFCRQAAHILMHSKKLIHIDRIGGSDPLSEESERFARRQMAAIT